MKIKPIPESVQHLFHHIPEACRTPYRQINESPTVPVYGFTEEDKNPKKKDVLISHLKQNSILYNNLFFDNEYVTHAMEQYPWLDYFYPSFKVHTYVSRVMSSIGGLCEAKKVTDEYIKSRYNKEVNWYKAKFGDPEHVRLCIRIYDMVKHILSDGLCTVENVFTDDDLMIMWLRSVETYYECMMNEPKYSPKFFQYAQALHDLMWDPLDDPKSAEVKSVNAASILANMQRKPSTLSDISEADSGEMVQKEDLEAWVKKELSDSNIDTYYLLPKKKKYLIFDADGIKYAMDAITKVAPEDRYEYASNLNRLYYEFKPDIHLSVDHPYAKYVNTGKYKLPTDIMYEVRAALDTLSEGVLDEPEEDDLPYEYRYVDMAYRKKTLENLDPDHETKESADN